MGRDKSPARIAVLGGGAAGLSAAYAAASNGAQVDVYEARGTVGGALRSGHVREGDENSYAYDFGAASMTRKYKRVVELLRKIKVPMVGRGDDANTTYVLHRGVLEALPRGPGQLLRTKLLSFQAKIRVLLEPLVKCGEPKLTKIESVADFFARRFHRDVSDTVVDAAMTGIYAASPASLSMRHAFSTLWKIERDEGSVILPMLARIRKAKKSESAKELRESVTAQGGMQAVPVALERALQVNGRARVRTGTPVWRLSRRGDGSWRVNRSWARYDAVVCALPAYALQDISSNVSSISRAFSRLTKMVTYAPIAVSVLGYRTVDVSRKDLLSSVGVLVPSGEQQGAFLGVQFSSSSFPGKVRLPEEKNMAFFTVYAGGMRALNHVNQELSKIESDAHSQLTKILGVTEPPTFKKTHVWSKAIPQYTRSHEKVVRSARRLERAVPGLVMAGNYIGGVAVPDALLSGMDASRRALLYVEKLGRITEKVQSFKIKHMPIAAT